MKKKQNKLLKTNNEQEGHSMSVLISKPRGIFSIIMILKYDVINFWVQY